MLRAVYVDLDGTLLGPGGSLLRTGDGAFGLDAVRALQACDRAGVEVLIYSGRRYVNVYDTARLIGQQAFIFELGCGLSLDGEVQWLTSGVEPSQEQGTIWQQIAASGAPAVLAEAFPDRLEEHFPWSANRDVTHLYRGEVGPEAAARVLDDAGLSWLRLVDNGVIAGHGVTITDSGIDVDCLHVYHLMPSSASKARAVARHMQNRGYAREECIAIGDSREDMGAVEVVDAFWMMANGVERDPTLGPELAGRPGVRLATEGYGAGVYEAVVTTLAERA